MRLRPLFSAAALVAMVATTVGASVTMAGGPSTRMVDDDGSARPGDCDASGPASTRIQDAVDAAGAGDTILVCPGTYRDHVWVEGAEDLTIRSVRPWAARIVTPATLEGYSLVSIVDSVDVTLQWFTMLALADQPMAPAVPTPTCQRLDAAIAVSDSTGVTIRSNRIDAKGKHTLGACGYSVGIEVGPILMTGAAVADDSSEPVFRPVSAKLVNNVIKDFQVVGIGSVGPRTRVDVVQNSIQYRHERYDDACVDGIDVSSVASRPAGRVSAALADAGVRPSGPIPIGGACFAFGILDLGGTSGTIRANEVWSNAVASVAPGDASPSPLLLAGIVEVAQGAAASEFEIGFKPQTDAPVITGNRIRGAIAGVALVGGDLVRITDNTVRYAFVGLFLSQTQDARATDNRLRDVIAGIWVSDEELPILGDDRDSSDNQLRRNVIPASPTLEVSCVDDTAGGGTLGTANTWMGNIAPADSSQPGGLCGPVS